MTTLISSQPQQLPLSQPPTSSPSSRSPSKAPPAPLSLNPSSQYSCTPQDQDQDREELDEEELDDEDLELLGMKRGGRRHKAGIPTGMNGNSAYGGAGGAEIPNTPTSKASIRSNKSLARDPTMKDSGTGDVSIKVEDSVISGIVVRKRLGLRLGDDSKAKAFGMIRPLHLQPSIPTSISHNHDLSLSNLFQTRQLADFLRATGPDGPPPPPSRFGSSSSGLPEPPSPSLTSKRSNGFLAKAGRSIGIGRKSSEKNLKSSSSKSAIQSSPLNTPKSIIGSNKSNSSPASKELEKQKERAFDEQLRKSTTTKRVLPNGGGYYPLAGAQNQPGGELSDQLGDPISTTTSTTNSTTNSPIRNSIRLKRDSISMGRKQPEKATSSSSSPSKISTFEYQSSQPFGNPTIPSVSEQSTFVSDLGSFSSPTVSSAPTGPVSIAAIRRGSGNASYGLPSGMTAAATGSSVGHGTSSYDHSQDGLVTLRPASDLGGSNDSNQSAAAAIAAAYKNETADLDKDNNASSTLGRQTALARSSAAQQHGLGESPVFDDSRSRKGRSDSRGASSSRSSSRVAEFRDRDPNQQTQATPTHRSISLTSNEAFHSAQPSPVSVLTNNGRPADSKNGSGETSSMKSSSSNVNLKNLQQGSQSQSQPLPVKSTARKAPPSLNETESASKPELSAIPPMSPFNLPQESQIGSTLINSNRSNQISQSQSQIRKPSPPPFSTSLLGSSTGLEAAPFSSYLPSPVDPNFPTGSGGMVSNVNSIPQGSSSSAHSSPRIGNGNLEEIDASASFKGHSRKPSASQRVKAMMANLGRSRSSSHDPSEVENVEREIGNDGDVDLENQVEHLDVKDLDKDLPPITPPKEEEEVIEKEDLVDPPSQNVVPKSSSDLQQPFSVLNENSSSKDLFNALQIVQTSMIQLQLEREKEMNSAADLCKRAAKEIQRLRNQLEIQGVDKVVEKDGVVVQKGESGEEKEKKDDVVVASDDAENQGNQQSKQETAQVLETPSTDLVPDQETQLEASDEVKTQEEVTEQEQSEEESKEVSNGDSQAQDSLLTQLLNFNSNSILNVESDPAGVATDPSQKIRAQNSDEISPERKEKTPQVQVLSSDDHQESIPKDGNHLSADNESNLRLTSEGSSQNQNSTSDSSLSQLNAFPKTPSESQDLDNPSKI